ncbi:MAG: glycoside hydrolase family 95 protein [Spirochaetaceae bacterium]|jgi:alpha-L-fucosidase 2|nr:glycoside hydrolase family 95 protein [Spirochaetaceae bacterium]
MGEHTLIWENEAGVYYEAAPVGNGRIGAMLFGGMVRERILLNESGMWSGSVQDADRPEAHRVLPKLRELLLCGKYKEAAELYHSNFTCKGPGSAHAVGANSQFGCYQTLGDLNLYFYQSTSAGREPLNGYSRIGGAGQCEDVIQYSRQLDMKNGVSSMKYHFRHGGFHERECIASRVDDCVGVYINAGGENAVSFNLQLSRPEKFKTAAYGRDGIVMSGQLENGVDGRGVKYAAIVRIKAEDGDIYTEDAVLFVRGAKNATIYITMASDYRGFAGRQNKNALEAAEEDMRKVFGTDWMALRERAAAAHRNLYERSSFDLEGPRNSGLPVNKRLDLLRRGRRDYGLYELLYNFSRYLLISSNRPDGLPANLQGIWGDEIQTAWNGDWHLDAQQMNFWGAETTGLPELHEPYLRLIHSLTGPGEKTAKAYYNARGWVAHTFTNPWGFTSPGEDASWGATTCGSAWLCQHLWDHFLFSNDMEYLKWAYPVLRGSALFYLDMLIRDPKSGYWVTAPANSPENSFIAPDGQESALCVGPTVDNQLIRYVFNAVIKAAETLGLDSELIGDLSEKRAGLAPSRVGADGGVMEWLDDYPSAKPNHRHISHLWGVYPGDEITAEDTPELAKAAKRSIVIRGKASPGWANMYRAAIFARIRDGDAARELFDFQLCTGSYPNLFCRTYHAAEQTRLQDMPEPDNYSYPFQIDANLAVSGCIAELLIQSHRYTLPESGDFRERIHHINLLPALPDDWESGKAAGLRARGGFILDMEWRFHTLVGLTIRSTGGTTADLSFMGHTVRVRVPQNGALTLNGRLETAIP